MRKKLLAISNSILIEYNRNEITEFIIQIFEYNGNHGL